IANIQNNGNIAVYTVEPANLNEAFKQLYIDYSYKDDYLSHAQLKGGVTTLDIPPLSYTLAPGFNIEGKFQLNIPDVQIKYIKQAGKTMPDTVEIKASINTNGSTLTLQGNGSLTVDEKRLYTYNKLPL